jgi:hypothetical protein
VGSTIPLGRLAEPDDVGGVCVFLASPLAAYVSGAVLVLHGGGEVPAYQAAADPDAVSGATARDDQRDQRDDQRVDRRDDQEVAR